MTSLQGRAISKEVSQQERWQILANNLVLASSQNQRALCLRILSSILYWVPNATLSQLDDFCEEHQIPIILVANITGTWDQTKQLCVDPSDCFGDRPYILNVICAPRNRCIELLQRIPMDPTRPQWIRTPEENATYLAKSGILISWDLVRGLNYARKKDPVLAGNVELFMGSNQNAEKGCPKKPN